MDAKRCLLPEIKIVVLTMVRFQFRMIGSSKVTERNVLRSSSMVFCERKILRSLPQTDMGIKLSSPVKLSQNFPVPRNAKFTSQSKHSPVTCLIVVPFFVTQFFLLKSFPGIYDPRIRYYFHARSREIKSTSFCQNWFSVLLLLSLTFPSDAICLSIRAIVIPSFGPTYISFYLHVFLRFNIIPRTF